MLRTKSKRLATVMLLVIAFLGSVIAFSTAGFTHTVSAEGGTTLPAPIAKYMFDDDNDIGKDSVGNYGMSIIGGKNSYTKVDGGIEFDGNFALAMTGNNLFENLSEFTMCFEMKSTGSDSWRNIIGIALSDGNYLYFDTSGGDVRFHVTGLNEGGYWSGAAINEPKAGYTRFTVTAKAGGYLHLYINGVDYQNSSYADGEKTKIAGQLPENWTLFNAGDNGYVFSIGAPANKGGQVGLTDKGGVKELVFFGSEMSAEQVTEYWNQYAAAHAKVQAVDVDFTQTVVVSEGATDAFIMENIVKKGNFNATMSDGTQKEVTVEWTGVVEKDGKRCIEGNVSGANNPDGVKAYASITEKAGKLTEANLDLSSTIVVPTGTPAEAILSLVPDKGNYLVTIEDGTQVLATIDWNEVTTDKNGDGSDTNTYIKGDVTNVTNTDNVYAYAKIYATAIDLKPIAKYEFNDPANPGKDSMGQYDMTTSGTVTVQDGAITFDGTSGYLSVKHDFTDEISSFSLSFEIMKPSTTNTVWAAPVFFGVDNTAKKWLAFNFSDNSNLLRFSMSDRMDGTNGNITGNTNECWGAEIGNVSTTNFDKVMLTVKAGGKCVVYFNGAPKCSFDVPADLSMASSKLKLELGKAYNGNGDQIYFGGSLKNVAVFDFALTESQVKVYEQYNQVLALAGDNYIESFDAQTLTFDNGAQATEELTDQMTTKDMLEKLNTAKVETLLADGTKGELPVYWESVVKENGNYIAKGFVKTAGLSVPYILENRQVTYTLDVKKLVFVEVDETLANGEIVLNIEEGYAGDVVAISVTPAQGYELVNVTVNGNAIEAVEGNYSYTIADGDTQVVVNATFKKVITLTINNVTGGTITADKEGKLNVGDVVTITVTPTSGYELATVTVNGNAIEAVEGTYAYTVAEGDAEVVISATYTRYYTVSAAAVENATVELSAQKAYAGDEITVTVTPAKGYQVKAVKVNGTVVTATDGVYKFTVNADSTVEVELAKEKVGCMSSLDSSSMFMMFVMVMALGTMMLIRRRKNNN